jgi:hypothetical protein
MKGEEQVNSLLAEKPSTSIKDIKPKAIICVEIEKVIV